MRPLLVVPGLFSTEIVDDEIGHVWGRLIDAAAVFMTLVSVTGLSLIFFLAKWRRSGLAMLAAGAAVSYVLYLVFVP